MEHHGDELEFIEWWEQKGQHIDWKSRVDESRRDVRSPESIDELFCDDCNAFCYRVGVLSEKHVCSECWTDRGYADQQQLDEIAAAATETGPVYAVVGCGKTKKEGSHPARELYDSTYFQKKRKWAEEFIDKWWILSAEHGLLEPETEIESYDTTVEEIDVEPWIDELVEAAEDHLSEAGTVWVLAGQRYVDVSDERGRTPRNVFNQYGARYPYDQTQGIGDQQLWLDHCLEQGEPAMPYRFELSGQTALDDF